MLFGIIKRLLFRTNKLNSFVNKYKAVAKEVGLPSNAYVNWGIKLLGEGHSKEALKMFETSVNMAYKNPDGYINLGILKAKEGDFEEALECFRRALRIDRTSGKAYSLMGSVYSEMSDYKKAKKCFDISLKFDSRDSQTYINRAVFLAKFDRKEEANESFKKACMYNPSNMQGIFLWGVLLSQMGKFEAAVEKFQKVHSMLPFHTEALYYLAYCFFQLKLYKQAVEYAGKALVLAPDKLENYIVLAESYMNLKREDECIKTYEKALELKDLTSGFYSSWGLSLQSFQRWEEAAEKFKKASELDFGKNIFPYYGLSVSYLKTGKEDEAYETMQKILEINPEHTITLYNIGQYFFKKEDYKNAVQYFIKAKNSSNDTNHIYFNIANCYHRMEDYKNSLKYWEKTVEYNPDNVDAKVNLANAYAILGQKDTAIRKIRSAYLLDKNNPRVIMVYAVLLLKNDEFYDAMEKFEKAYGLDNNLILAAFGKIECLIRINKPKEALGLLDTYEKDHGDEIEFLTLKILAYVKLIECEGESEYLIRTTLEVCDKMFSIHGECDEWIREKYNELKQKLEKKEE